MKEVMELEPEEPNEKGEGLSTRSGALWFGKGDGGVGEEWTGRK